MKKITTLFLVALIALMSCFALTGCNEEETESYKFGKELLRYDSQLQTLKGLKDDEIDVSIIDSVMAGYYSTTGDYKDDIAIIDDLILAQEKYGIAGRKEDKAFVSKINEALIALSETAYETIGESYGLSDSLCVENDTVNPLASATDNSWNEIVNSGKIVIGYTIFAPICWSPPIGPDKYLLTFKSVASEISFAVVPVPHKLNFASVSLFFNAQFTISDFLLSCAINAIVFTFLFAIISP